MTREIFTAGYVRSGNTWLNRMLGDLLDSPLQAEGDSVVQYWGPYKSGQYRIRKTHITWKEDRDTITSRGPVVFIQRDPRDVAVSISFYRGRQPIRDVINQFTNTVQGTRHIGYEGWLRHWLDSGDHSVSTRYETLHEDGWKELHRIANALGARVSEEKCQEVFIRQSFGNILSKHPEHHHSMRSGTVGDWMNHFDVNDAELIDDKLGDFMLDQGYIDHRDWWRFLI